MTETHSVSIDEVRALVAERQRYDDWLTALEARRAETPERVFVRVHADYATRRRDVMSRLREHVAGLAAMTKDLESRLAALESRLGALEDERAEAMLRTAVGEFDGERWEQVRQHVETQIAELGEARTGLSSELEEVRTLLASARSAPEAEPAVEESPSMADRAGEATAPAEQASPVVNTSDAASHRESMAAFDEEPMVDVLVSQPIETVPPVVLPMSEGSVDLHGSLTMFTHGDADDRFEVPTSPVSLPSLDGLDVFDDAELGDLRMSPPARATATATPLSDRQMDRQMDRQADQPMAADAAAPRDGFDDLAFLRSVVDPSSGQAGVARGTSAGEQVKTLRCTECGTMNFPTEWYCERCGGELAAF
jgi:hypothetical protein